MIEAISRPGLKIRFKSLNTFAWSSSLIKNTTTHSNNEVSRNATTEFYWNSIVAFGSLSVNHLIKVVCCNHFTKTDCGNDAHCLCKQTYPGKLCIKDITYLMIIPKTQYPSLTMRDHSAVNSVLTSTVIRWFIQ